ncbi:MAG: VIT domain-containing protein [Thermomicrobiales bacterium]
MPVRARLVFSIALLMAFAAGLVMPLAAQADGVIIVDPPLCDPACPKPIYVGDQLIVKSHRVDVTIADQVATTRIDQVFNNPNDWVAEGTYIFPIPDGATVDKFTMVIDGDPVEAKILSADQARAIYDDIVRQTRDPALLEYAGQGAIQASIFPIQPGQDRRIQIEYQQVLTAEGGLMRYVYPLNTERFSAQPLEQVSVHVAVSSTVPIRAVYSPSHEIAVDRQDDTHFSVGWEAANVTPTTDFDLIYTVSQDEIGANLLSYYDAATQEGYFMLLAAPGVDAAQTAVAKDVIVVLDTSGSMAGEKIEQAKSALNYVLAHLNAEDRFNIVEFSTGVRFYENGLQPVSAANQAQSWVSNLQASGGTDINRALLEAMAMVQPERPTYILFLTDGLPTEGEVEVSRILGNVDAVAPDNVRLFSFGVGYDVDTMLLDSLAQDHHGTGTYVTPDQPLDEVVSGFYNKVSTPVLTDISLDFGGAHIDDVYPQPLPDIFAGTQLVVSGRYRAGGPATITLTGKVNGASQSFTYQGQSLVSSGGDDFLPRLWATRKIGYLLNQIRLNGEQPELVQAIVDLSVRFGIVTPYTSYLITDNDILTQQGREAAAQKETSRIQDAPTITTGQDAVAQAGAANSMAEGDAAPAAPADEYADAVKLVGARSFVNQSGVWTETTFDPSTMHTIKVQFASDDYFKLLELRPDLADAFAIGDHVIALSHGVAFEVTPDSAPPIDFDSLGA